MNPCTLWTLQPCTVRCVCNHVRQRNHTMHLDNSNRKVLVLILSVHSKCNKDSWRQHSTHGSWLKWIQSLFLILELVKKISRKPSVEEQRTFYLVYSFSKFTAGQIITPKGAETVIRVNSAIRHLASDFKGALRAPRIASVTIISRYTKAYGLSSVIKTGSEPSEKC